MVHFCDGGRIRVCTYYDYVSVPYDPSAWFLFAAEWTVDRFLAFAEIT